MTAGCWVPLVSLRAPLLWLLLFPDLPHWQACELLLFDLLLVALQKCVPQLHTVGGSTQEGLELERDAQDFALLESEAPCEGEALLHAVLMAVDSEGGSMLGPSEWACVGC